LNNPILRLEIKLRRKFAPGMVFLFLEKMQGSGVEVAYCP
jgi:hypothetical protein